jgi:hypothetical protein
LVHRPKPDVRSGSGLRLVETLLEVRKLLRATVDYDPEPAFGTSACRPVNHKNGGGKNDRIDGAQFLGPPISCLTIPVNIL